LEEPKKVPYWKKFTSAAYQEFKREWLNYTDNNEMKKISELTSLGCKFQSSMYFDDLFDNVNLRILEICDLHFGIVSKDNVVAKLKKVAMGKRFSKPDLDATDDYVNRFLNILYDIDDSLWPSASETLYVFINGFSPASVKEALKRAKPLDLREAACKAREICKSVIKAKQV